jgi:hypothetical protein
VATKAIMVVLVLRLGGLRPSPKVCCLRATKRFGTSFRNCRIGLFAGHYCPAAFLDEHPTIPSVADRFQLGETCGCVRRLVELGGVMMPMTPAEFGKHIADETEKWAKVIKFAGIKPE